MTEPVDQHKSVASKVDQFEEQHLQRYDDRVILILDVSCDFFHPEIKRTVYCELPEEDNTEGQDQVGKLSKTVCGTRDASAEWEGNYSEVFEGASAKTGFFSPRLFLQEQTKLKVWVRGDDMC